ncbi:MAG: hypothetical protein LBK82_12965 [Planctomycetaceae bacterium]|jgi:hypothetical protein|nr:hypothetical protein [Planctomycetaceae bacterium]
MKNIINYFTLLSFVLILLAGCKSNPLGVVPVNGTVLLDGQPIEGVQVTFSSLSGNGVTAIGTTDAQGRFVLTTTGADFGSGAIPGEYAPTFSKTVYNFPDGDKVPSENYLSEKPSNVRPVAVEMIPARYAQSKTSGIESITVQKNGKNIFNFELKSK